MAQINSNIAIIETENSKTNHFILPCKTRCRRVYSNTMFCVVDATLMVGVGMPVCLKGSVGKIEKEASYGQACFRDNLRPRWMVEITCLKWFYHLSFLKILIEINQLQKWTYEQKCAAFWTVKQ